MQACLSPAFFRKYYKFQFGLGINCSTKNAFIFKRGLILPWLNLKDTKNRIRIVGTILAHIIKDI
jgi:hypothetical protein